MELDFYLGETRVDDEPEYLPYQDAGTTGSTVVGFVRSVEPDWERPLNRYDEPAEGDE